MDISLTVTQGNTATDAYSRELAKRLPGVNQLRVHIPHYGLYDRRLKHLTFARRVGTFALRVGTCRTSCIHFTTGSFATYFDFAPFVKKILTVHDIIQFVQKEHRGHPLLSMRERSNLNKADHIIAVSHNTKKDLVEHLGIAEEKITVVHSGVDHKLFSPRATRLGFPYILYVGTEQPRKNMDTTLRALHRLVREFKDLKLVKIGPAGREMYRHRTLQSVRELNLEEHVIFTGLIDETFLPRYYSSAVALVLPSLYEGFGLPVLEAMACGCPVITSGLSSLPEVAGEAGIAVDALDDIAIADAVRELASNTALREDMIARGLQRAGMFSWEKTARETLAVYNRCLEASPT